jgi:hypothetical protein
MLRWNNVASPVGVSTMVFGGKELGAVPVGCESFGEAMPSPQPLGGTETITLNVHIAVLPESSVAVQVTVVMPTGKRLPDGGWHITVGFGSQSSVAGGVL